jgi:hypothetical protein
MAVKLSPAYLAEIRKAANVPNVIIEVALDSGARRFGKHAGGFSDVNPCLKSVSSLQNKLDAKNGYSTIGQMSFTLVGRDNFTGLVKDNYLKNRRVTRRDGFVAAGFGYGDYAAIYSGWITDWSRSGDELTITVSDDLVDSTVSIPTENEYDTQYLDYRDWNPVDVMTDILYARLGIGASYIDTARFTAERDQWLSGWKVVRVLTEPTDAKDYLNELQQETNSFIYHDGEKITFKVFGPPMPGESVEEWTDGTHILADSLTQKSGYKDNFFNRVVVYYDYDDDGGDDASAFESGVIALDAASQDAAQWDETSTKTVYSKWLRSYVWVQPVNVTGVIIYHASASNGLTGGSIRYNYADKTLQWEPYGGSLGARVTVSEDGKYDVYALDTSKFIRVIVDASALYSGADRVDYITFYPKSGGVLATALAAKILSRYRDPSAIVAFDVHMNVAAYNSGFVKPTDFKDLTTDEACSKGGSTWNKKRVMVTSVRPDFAGNKVEVEAIDAQMNKRYGVIAPAGYADTVYGAASEALRLYAFISDANGKLAGTSDGYYIW